ncbi:tetratricopeptide repeat protein 1 [Pagrus major]|uniref:tetratricopeptide repeat protein 1 n=1 Tax=Pagrus major TaxID=143350 RepID=UPI003CC8D07F
MSSRGGGKPREQEKEEEENFYDCEETLEPSDRRGEREGKEETRQDEGGSEDFHTETDRLTDRTDVSDSEEGVQEEASGDRLQGDKLQEDAQGDRLQGDRLQQEALGDELQGDWQQEEAQGNLLEDDSDSELKEEKSQEVEFDDDYLREVEKDLTEEEKESRRQQSLTLKEKGNSQFKAGNWSEAELSYKEALVLCPVCFSKERAVLFSNRAAARLHLDLKDQAISDCTRAIELNPDYVRALLRRAELYEQTDKLDEALEDFKKVLELDPNQAGARQACMRLPQQIHERNEKLKEEMMSKLKDLGNLVLRPFGLSTNNFQVNQDANTGSYSINFVQSPNNNNR